ncbi:MAG TPA: ABC transporter substrate-binding protein, partial [Dehalococcoidia bacterium]|nr:ABC transporter substrate-binding protein [Dehalococcoidia bacterium]
LTAGLANVTVRPDGGAVLLQLPSPRASLPALLTQVPILPLAGASSQEVARLAGTPASVLATSGPYQVTGSTATDLELAANPHASAPPHLKTLDIRLYPTFSAAATAFSNGDVDALLATTPAERAQLLAVHGAHAHDIATFSFVDLLFNERTRGLDDAVVRQAIAAAVQRTSILRGALAGWGGLPQTGPLPAGIPWVAPANTGAAAPVDAAAALRADGWQAVDGVLQRGGVRLDFTVTVSDASPLQAVAREVAVQVGQLGIALHVAEVPPSALVSQHLGSGSFAMALAAWNAGPDPDVSEFWRSNAAPPHGYNFSGGAVDPFLDQALDSLATLTDRGARVAAARQVSALLAQDAPAAFVYAPEVAFVFRQPMRSEPVPAVGGSAARYDDIAAWMTQ